jgi:hypothetical protein
VRLIGAELSDGVGPLGAGFADAEEGHGLGDCGGQGGHKDLLLRRNSFVNVATVDRGVNAGV